MRKKDRERLGRLYGALNAVPYPQSGSGGQTASIKGYVEYSEDMRELIPWLLRAVMGISLDGDPELAKGTDYDDPDQVLGAIEAWVARRNADQWQRDGLLTARVTDFMKNADED